MLILTPNQLQEVLSIIDKHHSLFIATNIGTNYLSQQEKRTLKDAGVDLSKWKDKNGKIEEAFGFGMLSSAISDQRAKGMNYKDFKKFVDSKNFIPLTTREKAAIDHLKYQFHSDLKGLESKVKRDVNNIIVDEDKDLRTNFDEITRDALIKTVEMRGSVRDVISEIGQKTGQWNKSISLSAEYNLHTAYEEGRAAQLEREYGKDVLVYKDVYLGACKHCIKHYLTNGIGSQPIVFKLSELRANGTNMGKKVEQWRPTLGSLHYHCRCTLNYLPEGYVWSDEEGKFVRGKSKVTNERIKNRKKVTVEIGGVEYKV